MANTHTFSMPHKAPLVKARKVKKLGGTRELIGKKTLYAGEELG